jgi:uncharacterized protein YdbL (DUF1318 family)
MRQTLACAFGLALVHSAALAQGSGVPAAIEAGTVGERYDGYMGFVSPPSEELRRQITGINIQRRSLYTQLASQRGVTAQIVGLTTACALLRELPVGEAFMLKDNVWQHRLAGQPAPNPDYCH